MKSLTSLGFLSHGNADDQEVGESSLCPPSAPLYDPVRTWPSLFTVYLISCCSFSWIMILATSSSTKNGVGCPGNITAVIPTQRCLHISRKIIIIT